MNEITEEVSSAVTTRVYEKTVERAISPEDARMVKRLVGYWEYLKALQSLDQLSRSLSDSERNELDAYIRGRNIFAIDAHQSKELQTANSSLTDPLDADEEQRGLNWITALARVELGSMLAAYTKVPRPFEVVRPTKDDIDAYRYLLLDGVRSHYWALKQDPDVEYLFRSNDITKVLAYSRRMIMVRSMLGTLTRSGRDWTYPETQEIATWNADLAKLQGMLNAYIRKYLSAYVDSGRNTRQSRSSDYLTFVCGSILAGQQAELAAGTATVETYSNSYSFGEVDDVSGGDGAAAQGGQRVSRR